MFSSYKGQLRTFEFKNETGETIPPFACMIVTGATNQSNELVLSIRKPNADDATNQNWWTVAFNIGSSVPDGNNGRCTMSYPVLAVVADTISAGDTVGPANGEWFLKLAGNAFFAVVSDASMAYVDGTTASWLLQPNPKASFDVRVKGDGSALQKSTDGGATWTDWATIGACA